MDTLLLIILAVGFVVGILGAFIVKNKGFNFLITVGIGLVGAYIAYWALGQVFFNFESDRNIATISSAVMLSIIFVWLSYLLKKRG